MSRAAFAHIHALLVSVPIFSLTLCVGFSFKLRKPYINSRSKGWHGQSFKTPTICLFRWPTVAQCLHSAFPLPYSLPIHTTCKASVTLLQALLGHVNRLYCLACILDVLLALIENKRPRSAIICPRSLHITTPGAAPGLAGPDREAKNAP